MIDYKNNKLQAKLNKVSGLLPALSTITSPITEPTRLQNAVTAASQIAKLLENPAVFNIVAE